MSEFVFETGITYGDDRGSLIPLQRYAMKTTAQNFPKLRDEVAGIVSKAVEQVSDEPFNGHTRDVWTDSPVNPDSMDEKDRMFLTWDYQPTQPVLLPSNARKAAQVIVKDILNSEEWADTLGVEAIDRYGDAGTAYEAVDFTAAWEVAVAPQPVHVPIGTQVHLKSTIFKKPRWSTEVYTYMGLLPENGSRFDRANGEYFGPEENVLPAEFVAQQKYDVEVFPLPSGHDSNWWARSKAKKKVEGFGRLRTDAIQDVRLQLAAVDFWV